MPDPIFDLMSGRGRITLTSLCFLITVGSVVTFVKILGILSAIAVGDRHKPSLSVATLSIPASNYTTSNASTIYFDLKLRNKNKLTGFYYHPLKLTFSYGHGPPMNTSMSTVAEYTVPAFYQGYKRTAYRSDHVEIVKAGGAALAENTTGRAVFMVDLVSVFKYKSMFGKSKTKKLVVSGNVEVNYTTGLQVVLNNIKLKHPDSAGGFGGGRPTMIMVFSTTALILFVL